MGRFASGLPLVSPSLHGHPALSLLLGLVTGQGKLSSPQGKGDAQLWLQLRCRPPRTPCFENAAEEEAKGE